MSDYHTPADKKLTKFQILQAGMRLGAALQGVLAGTLTEYEGLPPAVTKRAKIRVARKQRQKPRKRGGK